MKKLIRAIILAALCAAVLAASGCTPAATEEPAVPESSTAVVSDTNAPPAALTDESWLDDETLYVHPDADCSVVHSLFDEGKTRRCVVCGIEGKTPEEMPTGFITREETVIDIGKVIFIIDPNVYVPGDVEQKAAKIVAAIEAASGLSFSDAKYNENIVTVYVGKEDHSDNENIEPESETGSAWAEGGKSRVLKICSGDLLLGNDEALVHELSHTLNYSHSSNMFCQVASEGFSTYNSYKTLKLLEKTDPETAYLLAPSSNSYIDMEIYKPEAVYTQPFEYWMENGFPYEYSGNGSYSLGFRFMAYLDEVYGDYTRWIPVSDEIPGDDFDFPIKAQLIAFRQAYGDDVFDGFYPWLKENESRFAVDYSKKTEYDLTGADAVTIYPFFMSFDCPTDLVGGLTTVRYNDLYVDLEETKKYLSQYKGRSLDKLVLNIKWLEGEKSVELFDVYGESMGVVTGKTSIPISDVSFVRLCGEGVLDSFSVSGYEGY